MKRNHLKLILAAIILMAICQSCASIGLFKRNGLCPAYNSYPKRNR